MIPKECKRLAEVDFPIAVVSKHSAREKGIRHGHPSTLHLWWARRPLAACRAMLMALLLPDPCDSLCPPDFKRVARELLPDAKVATGKDDLALRKALMRFIGDFADWNKARNDLLLRVARGLVHAAHPTETPLVVDPFAGGGSIPLEALRVGCDAFATDLNPVACLILKTLLEDIPRHGLGIGAELRRAGGEILSAAEAELADLYPADPDGARPIAYLWARTVWCEAPNCGAEIPLVRSFWLSKKVKRRQALRPLVTTGQPPRVEFEVYSPKDEKDVRASTVTRAKATCMCCGSVLPPERVRAQLAAQRGGADVIFDAKGRRVGGALMLAVVVLKDGEAGRRYRLPTDADYSAIHLAQDRLRDLGEHLVLDGLSSAVPDEPTPVGGGSGAGRAFSFKKYGMLTFGDMFSVRQKLALVQLSTSLRREVGRHAEARPLVLSLGKLIDLANAACRWEPIAECPRNVFAAGRVKPAWDFAEGVPIGASSGSYGVCVENLVQGIESVGILPTPATCAVSAAQRSLLPDETAGVWFTDPPYYDAYPYADLSDVFFAWFRRILAAQPWFRDPFDADNNLTPKEDEAVEDESRTGAGRKKNRHFFESAMGAAFAEGRRVLRPDGIGCVVFAHKTTEGWEALIGGIVSGGLTITASWPIATELVHRLRARDSAALATSVHLVCRPRPPDAPVGEWSAVLRELPRRVADWMTLLQSEGIRGADLVFACIGPALEIFSRYSRVETAEGREVGLPEYLVKVWEVVARAALEQVLGVSATKDGAGSAVEEDARLTALFLWTLQATEGVADVGADDDNDESADADDDDEDAKPTKAKGYTLVHDVVRRFAQPLGIRLEDWEGRIIETKKGVVRLLPVAERAKQLFGDEASDLVATVWQRLQKGPEQADMFTGDPEAQPPTIRAAHRGRADITGGGDFSLADEATTLDRIHAAMLLQKGGRSHALRAMLVAEAHRGPDFLRLANALSALYPTDAEEKRLLDAMLLAAPRG